MTRIRPLRTTAALAALLATSALPAFASGPVPVGPAFRLTPCQTCRQHGPAVAGAPSGTFLVAFDMKNTTTGPVVQQRFFKTSGLPAAPPAIAQAPGGPPQYDAAVGSNALGAFVVAWSAVNGSTSNSDILAHRFDATGKALGTDIQVSVDGPGLRALDTMPVVALSSDGGFTVAWLRLIPPGQAVPAAGTQVWARRFTAAGLALGPAIQLSSGLVEGKRPGLCVDTLKRAVVTWTTVDAVHIFEPNLNGVALRRVNINGGALGAVVAVARPTSNTAQSAISCGPAGTFVVAWETNQAPAASGDDILVQRFATTGKKNGPAVVVNTETVQDQRFPAITTDAGGNFVVVWKDLNVDHYGIYGQRFSAAAAKVGAEFNATNKLYSEERPSVAAAGAANAFVVAWEDVTGVLGRRFKVVP
ncbi:MAG: hypothetical protein ABI609_13300 [Acidobacteriota bacterium]